MPRFFVPGLDLGSEFGSHCRRLDPNILAKLRKLRDETCDLGRQCVKRLHATLQSIYPANKNL